MTTTTQAAAPRQVGRPRDPRVDAEEQLVDDVLVALAPRPAAPRDPA